MDLILRNASLCDGRTDIDVGIEGGRVVAMARRLAATARQEIDVAGKLVSPPFVDPHFHLDTALSHGFPRRNATEDFYILNKLAKVGSIARLAGTPVILEGRLSDRVPIGTKRFTQLTSGTTG